MGKGKVIGVIVLVLAFYAIKGCVDYGPQLVGHAIVELLAWGQSGPSDDCEIYNSMKDSSGHARCKEAFAAADRKYNDALNRTSANVKTICAKRWSRGDAAGELYQKCVDDLQNKWLQCMQKDRSRRLMEMNIESSVKAKANLSALPATVDQWVQSCNQVFR